MSTPTAMHRMSTPPPSPCGPLTIYCPQEIQPILVSITAKQTNDDNREQAQPTAVVLIICLQLILIWQARCKFLEQFDETAKTMSSTMKSEIALRTEQERQRRTEWEVRAPSTF